MPDNHPIADGSVETGPDGSTQVHFVRRLPHPVERVWQALTDPATRTTITWELDPDGDHTLLHLTNTIPGSPDHPDTTGPSTTDTTTAAGWHLHLEALAALLSGGQLDIAHPEPLFEPIHQAYTQKHGPGSE